MKIINWIAYVLLIIGGLNWGAIGIAGIDVLEMIIGVNMVLRIIYILVGLSAIWAIFSCCKNCKTYT